MKRKNRKTIIALCLSLALVLTACGGSATEANESLSAGKEEAVSAAVTNEEAGDAVKSALESRWAYQDSLDESAYDSASVLIDIVAKELEPVAKYYDAEFEDEAVKTAMIEYIDALNEMKSVYEKSGEDLATIWYDSLILKKDRREALRTLADLTGFTFEGQAAKDFESVLNDTEPDMLPEDAVVVDSAFTIYGDEATVDYGDDNPNGASVKVRIKNNCKFTFPDFEFVYRVKDSNGVMTSSQEFCDISNFTAESEAYAEAYVERPCTVEFYGFIYGTDDLYVSPVIELDEPIVLNVE